MVEIFWRIVTLLLTAAILMGLYFVMKEVVYGNDLSTQERVIYVCLILGTLFAGAFAIEKAKH